MEYIVNFLNLLIGRLGESISPSTLSSATQLSATGTFAEALDNFDDNSLSGTITTSVASAVSGAADDAYEQTKYNMNASQAYVQSMSQEELKYFIEELENYQVSEEISQPKVLCRIPNQGRNNR